MEQGLKQGMAKGFEKGTEAKSYAVVRKMIDRNEWTDEMIAELVDVTIDYVREVSDQHKK